MPIHVNKKSNKKCPECGKPLEWIEGLLHDGITDYTKGRYACKNCKITCRMQDSRAMKKGRRMARKYFKPDFKWTDIKHLPVAVQLGILREIQNGKNGYLNKK